MATREQLRRNMTATKWIERIYSKSNTRLHIADSEVTQELPKKQLGGKLEAVANATILYKYVKRLDGRQELEPVSITWTDNGVEYTAEIKGLRD